MQYLGLDYPDNSLLLSQHRNRSTPYCPPGNQWDACLHAERDLMTRIADQKQFDYNSRIDPNPDENTGKQIRLNEVATVTLPSAPVSNLVLLTYRVPPGYKGQITCTVNGFLPGAGATYVNGSGQLVFHLQRNFVYVFNYGSIFTDTGSLTSGSQSTGKGIEIQENQTIVYGVDVLSTTFGPGKIVAALQGYIQPIRAKRRTS